MLTIDELLDFGYKHACHVLIDQPEAQLVPTFHIQYKSGNGKVIAAPWYDDTTKEATIKAIKKMLRNSTIHSYSFISEAWVAWEDSKHPTGLRPSDRQDRREVVIISAFDHKGGKMHTYEIKRRSTGVIKNLTFNSVIHNAENLSGRFHNLLKEDQ